MAYLTEMRLIRADYLASIPAAERAHRDKDVAKIVQANAPSSVRSVIDAQLFTTPLTARTSDQVLGIIETHITNRRSRGGNVDAPLSTVPVAPPSGPRAPALPPSLPPAAYAVVHDDGDAFYDAPTDAHEAYSATEWWGDDAHDDTAYIVGYSD